MGKSIACEVLAGYGDLGEKRDRRGETVMVRLNKVSWYGRPATYDIRAWGLDGKADKGISLTVEMLKTLKEILCSMEELD